MLQKHSPLTPKISKNTIDTKKKSENISVHSNQNIYSYEIDAMSQCILEDKKKTDFPGSTIDDIIGNMKILDKWLN